tara:strand:+ start:127 stop:585 length:459 start_codon:yes stop_codon:yes gene_type:complete
MTRIRQFANDMGISYNEAKGLINKGKKRRDGGSTVLESYMPIVIREKKKLKVEKPKMRPKKDPFRADKTESLNRKFSMETAKANEKAIKQIKKAMGGLKDIPPENKGLPKLPKEVRNKMGFKKKGGTMKMKLGGVARGGGAAISGTGFKGVY